jgi:hypothetical protein
MVWVISLLIGRGFLYEIEPAHFSPLNIMQYTLSASVYSALSLFAISDSPHRIVSPVQTFAFRFSCQKVQEVSLQYLQVSQPHVRTVRVKVLYNRILTNLRAILLFVVGVMNCGHA